MRAAPLALVLLAAAPSAQVAQGDVALTRFSFDDEVVEFVALAPIPAGTVIRFTDKGFEDDGTLAAGEGTCTYTAPPAVGVAQGTVVRLSNGSVPTASAGTLSCSANFALNQTGGDQILVHLNDSLNDPGVIYALHSNGDTWDADATGATESRLPTPLVHGLTALAVSEVDNGCYTGTRSGSLGALLEAIATPANWAVDDSETSLAAACTNSLDAFTVTGSDLLVTQVLGTTYGDANDAGWRQLGSPVTSGLSVSDLAEQNLVQGAASFYPAAPSNLYLFSAANEGTAAGPYAAPLVDATLVAGLSPGFFWYQYDNTVVPDGPSRTFSLPQAIGAAGPRRGSDLDLTLESGLTATTDGFALLSNPFGAPYDTGAIGIQPSGGGTLSSVVQVWDPADDTYQTLGTDLLAPWQSGWVECLSIPASGTPCDVRFAASGAMPGGSPSFYGRRARVASLRFRLEGTLDDGTATNDEAIAVRFSPDAAPGLDPLDGSKLVPFTYPWATLAPTADGRQWASLALPPPGDVSVPLAFETTGSGTFVLTWDASALDPAWGLSLADLETGSVTDLRSADGYTFTAAAATRRSRIPTAATPPETGPLGRTGGAERFVLQVQAPGTAAGEAPAAFALSAPSPNPSSSGATVRIDLVEGAAVRLAVVDLLGREVAVPLEGALPAGFHAVRIGTDRLAPGLYVLRLTAGADGAVRRLVVAR